MAQQNKINCVRATLRGLEALRTKEEVAIARGKSVERNLRGELWQKKTKNVKSYLC